MREALPSGFLKDIFLGVSANSGIPLPKGFDRHIDTFSQYAEQLPLSFTSKQLTRHIENNIREIISQEGDHKCFYKNIKQDLLTALGSYTKSYLDFNGDKAKQFRGRINTFLEGRIPGGITISDIKNFTTEQEPTYGMKLYGSLYQKHGEQRPEYIKNYIGDEKAELYPIIRKIDLESEDIKKRFRPFLLESIKLGETTLTPSLLREKMNAEYAWIKRHCRDENNKLDRSIFMDKCIDEDLVEQINFEQIRVNFEPKDIKVNFRSLLSEMVKKGEDTITPTFIKGKMNSEYFRIKRHHKDTEGRIDRPTVANKYIGKVFLTQIKFEYVKRGLEYEDMKIRLRPFFLERIALGKNIITPSMISDNMNNEYAWIRKNCRHDDKIDRLTVLCKCIDEDILLQIKFHHRSEAFLNKNDISIQKRPNDISDMNHGKGWTNDFDNPETVLIEKEERILLEKGISQLPPYLQEVIGKFRNEEEVDQNLLKEAIRQMKIQLKQ